ncbi:MULTISPECIES: NAD(P)-dependent oxidoreductase [Pseudoxanthomonas]|jgi:putative NADH-flavin reductase|uniref:NAD(P)-dependent oxidoreductase n=1 Tax=Pseudoxanthomonas TaxID=83618 RepID=UPI00178457B0|nr:MULTISPECIES: NAD(P)H-binding protein [Pseudoxanthomonas]MBD9376775.1 NAD(P)H-binding protein [Pseudoxanthomonas sp. PXM04]
MKIALAAATGKIGRQIAAQAIARGHDVTAIVRRDTDLPPELDGARIVIAPLDDADALVAAVRGHDVLASAYGPQPGAESSLADVSDALIAAAREAGIPRVVVVGGAGSLQVAPGVQLVDVPDFPAAYKPVALAHRDALKRYQAADDLAWTFFSPAAEIGPGEARGQFRTQVGALLADADGKSAISYADYAEAFVAELEQARHPRQIITAAY